jgi:hypothetical protein
MQIKQLKKIDPKSKVDITIPPLHMINASPRQSGRPVNYGATSGEFVLDICRPSHGSDKYYQPVDINKSMYKTLLTRYGYAGDGGLISALIPEWYTEWKKEFSLKAQEDSKKSIDFDSEEALSLIAESAKTSGNSDEDLNEL